MKRSELSFTLIELMITVLIVGILATFVTLGFQRTIQGAREKETRLNLIILKTGQTLYKQHHGAYYPNITGWLAGISALNSNLDLNIIENPNFFYACEKQLSNYTCYGSYNGNGAFQYRITNNDDVPICNYGCLP